VVQGAEQATHVVGFSRVLESSVPDICDSPQTQERNHLSGLSAARTSGDVGTSLDIGHPEVEVLLCVT
jgi:hypothetical protein